jgi:hypothetical protein
LSKNQKIPPCRCLAQVYFYIKQKIFITGINKSFFIPKIRLILILISAETAGKTDF